MAPVDDNAVSALIKDVARTIILPRFQKLQPHHINTKTSPSDFVTIADTEAELALEAGLTALLPGSVVVGEESVSRDASTVDYLSKSGAVWVVDPIDGTRSFVEGERGFSCMVALVQDGSVVAGWIYDPLEDVLLQGRIGQGASRNGVALSQPESKPLTAMTGRLRRFHFRDQGVTLEYMAKKLGPFQVIAAAGDSFLALYDGRIDYALFKGSNNAWDILPGLAIVAAAGGLTAFADGSPYLPASRGNGSLLICPRADMWPSLAEAIFSPA